MLFRRLVQALLLSATAVQETTALAISGDLTKHIKPYKRGEVLQDIVTWDAHSLFVYGERVMLFSGEFHPYRLPVPSLWLDVFQKIKALGYNCVSFYTDWALHEGQPGNFTAEGIFSYDQFFAAASEAGIYFLARPGPYINAEVSGGGFPGWLQRNKAVLRTTDPEYLAATDNYMAGIGKIIAKAQITNGGPVILAQPENEYTSYLETVTEFPSQTYFEYVEKQLRDAGIVVPLITNEAFAAGYVTPTTAASPDIYGFDGYPVGFDCGNPYTWPVNGLHREYADSHAQFSNATPFSLVEFQGGSFDPWGGWGFQNCLELVGYEFERVFYKNNFAQAVKILNLYMTYGGTNWGNLGHPGGYTSYDYAAVIDESLGVEREKYSEAKLEANFLQASPAYTTSVYQNNTHTNGSYTGNPALTVTATFSDVTKFFVIRQANYSSVADVSYQITLPTSKGNITIPQWGGQLTLHGRDSKFHVTDYDVGGVSLLYSTAEIFTWKQYGSKRVLVVYGGPNEQHEVAVSNGGRARVVEGSGIKSTIKNGATVLGFQTSPTRRVVQLGCDLDVYILDRNSAYNYWVIDTPSDAVFGNFTKPSHLPSALIVKADYLLRTAIVSGNSVHLTGDLNATSSIEVIGGPQYIRQLTYNGKALKSKKMSCGSVTATATYKKPKVSLPDLSTTKWKVINDLPEIQSSYDDSKWTAADLTYTNNTVFNLTTPTSLSASDYGYNTGSLVYRGHFTATGTEKTLYLSTSGGSAYSHSIWLNDQYVGSFTGEDVATKWNQTYNLNATLSKGSAAVITVVIDHMGLDESYTIGADAMKNPRGILGFSLSGHAQSDVTWRLTGNLGGEDYADKTRGPLNEGGLYAERQGYHLPGAPTSSWKSSSGPQEGLTGPGIAFYSTTFDLDLPVGYDIPLSISFANTTSDAYKAANGTARPAAYRCQLFVNGYQFGKYVHNVGPQDVFPVPQGVWNYQGSNTLAVSLWVQETAGAKVDGFSLVAGTAVQSGFGKIAPAPQPAWAKRNGAY
ncbi:hypothetical protein LTR95_008279 [Oleoguttula sp. CCFEE 5521]